MLVPHGSTTGKVSARSGMVDEWRKVRLGELARIEHGWPFQSELFSHELSGRPIVIGIGNFDYSGGFRFDSTALKEFHGEYPAAYDLHPGDMLLVMTCQTAGGEILGIPARVPDDGRRYLHNQRLGKVVVTNPTLVCPEYLYWLFLTPEFNRHLVNSATGTKILHTAPSRIESFEFMLPPFHEQRRIAGIFGALADKIALSRRMSQTLESIASALFKSWFVDFDPVRAKVDGRDPGQTNDIAGLFPDSFDDADVGEIPKGWRACGLDEIAGFLNGLALQRFPANDGPALPVIKIAQLHAGKTVGADEASADIPSDYVVQDGDVLFSWSGSLSVELWCGGPGALNQHLFKVTSERYPKWFYYLWTRAHLADFREIAAGKATTMGHIQRGHLNAARVLV
jgi:type I restriction enzyme, S subunit